MIGVDARHALDGSAAAGAGRAPVRRPRAWCGGRAARRAPPCARRSAPPSPTARPGSPAPPPRRAFAPAPRPAPRAASTVIEKNTLPSLATMSDSVPVSGSGVPSGARDLARLASTCSLVTAMRTLSSRRRVMSAAHHKGGAGARSTAVTVDASAAPSQDLVAYRQRNARDSAQGGHDGEGGVSRSRRDGLPHGRASQEQGRPRGHRLQPHRRQGRQMGRAARRQAARRRRRKPPRARTSS